MIGKTDVGSVGRVGTEGMDVDIVGRVGEIVGGVEVGRVRLVRLGRLGLEEDVLNPGRLGPEMLERPLVIFGKTGTGVEEPGTLRLVIPVTERIDVGYVVLLLITVFRLQTTRNAFKKRWLPEARRHDWEWR